MRKTIYLFISLLVLASACSKQRPSYPLTRLEQIDTLLKERDGTLIVSHADSALHLLEQLTPADVRNAEDSAYMAILYIEANRRKTYFSRMTDSQLNALMPSLELATAYCHKNRNARIQLRLNQYRAEILWLKGRYAESVDCFLAAWEEAKKLDWLEEREKQIMLLSNRLIPRVGLKELGDGFVGIDAWKEHPDWETMALQALERIADESWSVQVKLLMFLQSYYEEVGNKEKVLWCAHRNVAARDKKNPVDVWSSQLFLATTYSQVGDSVTARHHRTKADSIERVLDKKYPNSGWRFDNVPQEKNDGLFWGIGGLIIVGVLGLFLYNRKQLRQSKKELLQVKKEVERLTPEADVFLKIEQIIEHHLRTAHSAYRMEKTDWNQLLAETNKRYSGVVDEWQNRYGLNEEELRIACLHLTEHPVTHLGYVMGYSRVSIYRKSKEVVAKLGGDDSVALRDFLKKTVVKRD